MVAADLLAEEADFAAEEETALLEEAGLDEAAEDDTPDAGTLALASRTAASSSGSSRPLRARVGAGEPAGAEEVVFGIPFLGGTRVDVEEEAEELALLATATFRALAAALEATATGEEEATFAAADEGFAAAATTGTFAVLMTGRAVEEEPGVLAALVSRDGGTPKPALMESRIFV